MAQRSWRCLCPSYHDRLFHGAMTPFAAIESRAGFWAIMPVIALRPAPRTGRRRGERIKLPVPATTGLRCDVFASGAGSRGPGQTAQHQLQTLGSPSGLSCAGLGGGLPPSMLALMTSAKPSPENGS